MLPEIDFTGQPVCAKSVSSMSSQLLDKLASLSKGVLGSCQLGTIWVCILLPASTLSASAIPARLIFMVML